MTKGLFTELKLSTTIFFEVTANRLSAGMNSIEME